MLRPAPAELDLGSVTRTLTIRVSEGFMEGFAAPLVTAVTVAAPKMRLRFAPKPDKNAGPIRDGTIDLEIGVLGTAAPEMRTRTLFRDTFVGVVRTGHPLLKRLVTPELYAAFGHVVASRTGRFAGPVDEALLALGLQRRVAVVVPGYPDAIRMARRSDLVALVPSSCLGHAAADDADAAVLGVQSFTLPVRTPEIAISATWHPRMDNDPVHRWLRDTVQRVCRAARPGNQGSRGDTCAGRETRSPGEGGADRGTDRRGQP